MSHVEQEHQRWICTVCGHFQPRSQIEAGVSLAPSNWRCEMCGSTGTFVPEDSSAGAELAVDLTLDIYNARLRAAGYPVKSLACNTGRHANCSGLTEDNQPCDCSCHAQS